MILILPDFEIHFTGVCSATFGLDLKKRRKAATIHILLSLFAADSEE